MYYNMFWGFQESHVEYGFCPQGAYSQAGDMDPLNKKILYYYT